MNISPVLITKNAASTISLTLDSLISFNEVIILDTGSTDHTMEIARHYKNVRLYKTSFSGFGRAKNAAAKLAKNDWILSIDADEVVTKELLESIRKVELKNNTIYKFRRYNYYKGRQIKFSGWGKEYVSRLYNKKITRFNKKLVHESINTDGYRIKELKGGIIHHSYLSISDFGRKRELYSELFAIEYCDKRKSSPSIAFVKAAFDFFNTYIIQLGCFDGYRGLMIATSNAYVTFTKYLKLYEANVEHEILQKSIIYNEGKPVHPEVVTDRLDRVTKMQLVKANRTASSRDIESIKSNLTLLN